MAMERVSFVDKTEAQIFSKFEERGIPVPDELKKSIQRKIKEISGYVPKVGVFGKTGVGKSSLCNSLFGHDVCSISDIQSCTRDPQEILLTIGESGQGIKLIDVPGVGEDRERDDEYDALYKELLPELDLIFWVFKGDDRANASDEDFYQRLVRPYVEAGKPFIAVINQVDKIEPSREWNDIENAPGIKQLKNIKEKCSHIANRLRLPVTQVVPVSANERYGLIELVDSVVHSLPREQKGIIIDIIQTAEDIRKEEAAKARELAHKEAEEAKRKAEELHKKALEAEEEKRRELEAKAREAEAKQRIAEERAEEERRRARRIEAERTISDIARQESESSTVSTILDAVESIPVVGRAVSFLRSLF